MVRGARWGGCARGVRWCARGGSCDGRDAMAVRTRTGGGLAARGLWVVWAVAAVVMGWMSAASSGQTGACCRPTSSFCSNVTEANCAVFQGTWLGAGVTCTPGLCAAGACCDGNSGCTITIQSTCGTTLAGIWQGAGTTCASVPPLCAVGSCCVSGNICVATVENDCAARGGAWRANIGCYPNACISAACCTSGGVCILSMEVDCINVYQGSWQGPLEPTCSPDPCPGARGCCVEALGRCQLLTYRACASLGGGFSELPQCASPLGIDVCFLYGSCCVGSSCFAVAAGVHCAGLFIAQQTCAVTGECPIGACCLTSGLCAIVRPDQCADAGSFYYGPGTVCDGRDCARIVCCGADSSCTVTTVPLCTSGTIRRDVQSCTPDPCPTGACCATFSGQCAVLSRTDCLKFDATFRGGVCDATLCTASTGACCLPGQLCVITSRDGCVPQYGYTAWLGPATACAPNPCCAVDIDDSGALNVSDLFEFLRLYFSGCP